MKKQEFYIAPGKSRRFVGGHCIMRRARHWWQSDRRVFEFRDNFISRNHAAILFYQLCHDGCLPPVHDYVITYNCMSNDNLSYDVCVEYEIVSDDLNFIDLNILYAYPRLPIARFCCNDDEEYAHRCAEELRDHLLDTLHEFGACDMSDSDLL